MIGVAVLGSTGSIGVSTLDVLARHPERYRVVALTAHRDVAGMVAQCQRFTPEVAVMADPEAAAELATRLAASHPAIAVRGGPQEVERVAEAAGCDYVMAAIVGAAGLRPALAAVRSGKRLLLANKEALVISGELLLRQAALHNATILPIDSEHNAVFQCLPEHPYTPLARRGVRRILLTASGGPFRTTPLEALRRVTPEQACAHPNWSMGRKISVDSATMMNKGLEVIEACYLFHATPEQVEVVVHPQSIIHSLVEYIDGSTLAQLGNPDMRTPIAHALAWPQRITSGVSGLDLFGVARLDFEPPDLERFPCLALAYAAARAGGTAPALLNAANEVAVAAFLERRIPFLRIAEVIAETLERLPAEPIGEVEQLLAVDRRARKLATQLLAT